MNHPFDVLLPEYASLLQTMQVRPERMIEVDRVAKKLLSGLYWPRYKAVQDANGVPGVWTAPVDERESGANARRALGQGDPWGEVSTHVPRGFGPFKSWSDAAIFYEHYDHVDDVTKVWSWPYACWKWEGWNGFGPRARGIHTGYLWGGTNHYDVGKYVADRKWDPTYKDMQLGVVPVAVRMAQLNVDLMLPGLPSQIVAPSIVPQAAPMGVGASPAEGHDVAWLQAALNHLLPADVQIQVDGNFGRETRTALWNYQRRRGLAVDGLFGPATDASLSRDIKPAAADSPGAHV